MSMRTAQRQTDSGLSNARGCNPHMQGLELLAFHACQRARLAKRYQASASVLRLSEELQGRRKPTQRVIIASEAKSRGKSTTHHP